jgi:hypothetical protein
MSNEVTLFVGEVMNKKISEMSQKEKLLILLELMIYLLCAWFLTDVFHLQALQP